MAAVAPVQPTDLSGETSDHEGYRAASMGGADVALSLDPELVRRFHALVDEVTDQLMQGGKADRQTCRADAIELLVATNAHLADSPETGESPLTYLLLEEQQRAAAVSGNRKQSNGTTRTFIKA